MTDRDAREELKDITRQLRRWLDREQWSGSVEIVASSVAAARPGEPASAAPRPMQPASAAPRPTQPASAAPRLTPPVPAPPSAARVAASAPPTHGHVAEPTPVMVPSDSWEPVVASAGRGAPRPSAPSYAAPAVAAPGPARTDVNLFGDKVPRPAPMTSGGVEVVDDPVAPLPPFHSPLAPIGEARRAILNASLSVLDEVATAARGCEKCGLCKTRTNAVPGVGSASSGIVFVGEAPGADEDAQGEPFVGRAGQLLTSMIQAMDDKQLIPGVKLDRSTVFICNVLKCRPPENRNPLPHEIEQCSPYLERQLEALQPRIICCLGKFSAELLTGVKSPSLGAMREKTYRYRGAKLIVTYHPAALLRNPNWKRPAWEDLQRLAREYQTD